jgi:hypothetical protein
MAIFMDYRIGKGGRAVRTWRLHQRLRASSAGLLERLDRLILFAQRRIYPRDSRVINVPLLRSGFASHERRSSGIRPWRAYARWRLPSVLVRFSDLA